MLSIFFLLLCPYFLLRKTEETSTFHEAKCPNFCAPSRGERDSCLDQPLRAAPGDVCLLGGMVPFSGESGLASVPFCHALTFAGGFRRQINHFFQTG